MFLDYDELLFQIKAYITWNFFADYLIYVAFSNPSSLLRLPDVRNSINWRTTSRTAGHSEYLVKYCVELNPSTVRSYRINWFGLDLVNFFIVGSFCAGTYWSFVWEPRCSLIKLEIGVIDSLCCGFHSWPVLTGCWKNARKCKIIYIVEFKFVCVLIQVLKLIKI